MMVHKIMHYVWNMVLDGLKGNKEKANVFKSEEKALFWADSKIRHSGHLSLKKVLHTQPFSDQRSMRKAKSKYDSFKLNAATNLTFPFSLIKQAAMI